MQPKLYVTNYPAGDFRAMPALGGGQRSSSGSSSFPGNPELGLPTVTGLVVLSDAETGVLQAVLDAGAVTALRTGAAAVLAAVTLGRGGSIAVVGCGVNGSAAADTFSALGLELMVHDANAGRAAAVAEQTGAAIASSQEEALSADIVVTVTPGRVILYPPGSLRPGQRVSLMGADGPGRPRSHWRSSAAGASSATTGSRRATAASSPRRWRSARCAATTSPSSAACSPALPRAAPRGRDHALRLHRARDPGPRDRSPGVVEGRRSRRAADQPGLSRERPVRRAAEPAP